jgi:Fe-S cluster assembly protein SufD
MVTEIATSTNSFQDAFRALQQNQTEAAQLWLNRLRESAMARFDELGFPTTHDEEWKYTNVAPLAKIGFTPIASATAATANDLESVGIPETRNSQLVFVNCQVRTDLSSLTDLPATVVVRELSEALADERYIEVIRENLARNADFVANSFTALNTALINTGAFVLIPKGVKIEAPLHLLFISLAATPKAATFPRVLLVAEENSSATLVESYVSPRDSQHFTNAVVEVVLKEGARLEHYKVQRESNQAFHIATTAADLGANSSYDATTVTFGAQLSRHDVHVNMDHEGAECWVDGLYLVTGSQHTDTHSVIDHRKPHCTSHQLYKGILDGKSRAVFNGKVFVRHDAQKTDAMQTNKNLLLSNEARVDTKPQLEILADDVKCAHGAAVGQIEEDELFYLEARGIHPDLARNLLTYGFAEEVIGKIKIESIRTQLDEAVLNRLNARLEV